MDSCRTGLEHHRVKADAAADVQTGEVVYSPLKSFWFLGMAVGAVIGGALTFSWQAFALFVFSTGLSLLFGYSLGIHRRLVHRSYDCPKWLEYFFVYLGIQVGYAGPIGFLRMHELRDYAQRQQSCHDYLRHGRPFWQDAWWQLNCELTLKNPPRVYIGHGIANDCFYRFLERTWMAQQIPFALLFYAWGGWAFVFWGTCARVTAGIFGQWVMGYFAHNHGRMHFKIEGAAVQGRNLRWVSLITMGECWHNNHHAYPGSARFGLAPAEWDPGWWALLALRRAGLAWNIVLPKDLPYRPELFVLDISQVESEHQGSAAEHTPVSLRTLITLAATLCRHKPSNTEVLRNSCIEWPAILIPETMLARITGNRIPAIRNPAATQFTLTVGATRVVGLPALALAAACKSSSSSFLARLLLPFAMLFEPAHASLAKALRG